MLVEDLWVESVGRRYYLAGLATMKFAGLYCAFPVKPSLGVGVFLFLTHTTNRGSVTPL